MFFFSEIYKLTYEVSRTYFAASGATDLEAIIIEIEIHKPTSHDEIEDRLYGVTTPTLKSTSTHTRTLLLSVLTIL
jgi:hypothetical protein